MARIKRFLKRILKALWWIAWRFAVLSVVLVLLFRYVNPPTTLLQIMEGTEHKGDWKPLGEISYNMPLAVIASEDQRFPEHWGFDTEAIAAAIEYNKTHDRKLGASTISQQTAKNVFLWPSRSWLRKGLEVWFTMWIELLWSKERIMEVYLNVIEMGPQCFGVDGAANYYFKKSPEKLSRSQCALIAAALPSPRKSNPGKPSAYLSKRSGQIQRQMRLLGGKNYLPWEASEKKLKAQ